MNGLTVTQLSEKVGKSRTQLYRAWDNPGQHRPTMRLIRKNLKGGRHD